MRAPYCTGALTPSGKAARVLAPQAAQQHVCARCSVTINGFGSGKSNTCRAARLQSRVFGHERRDLRRLRPDQRNQLFPRRLARRFENHPILESETESAVQKIPSPTRDCNHQTWAVTAILTIPSV